MLNNHPTMRIQYLKTGKIVTVKEVVGKAFIKMGVARVPLADMRPASEEKKSPQAPSAPAKLPSKKNLANP